MSDTGVDGGAVVNALAMRAAALLADLAVKDVQIAQLQERVTALEKGAGDAVKQP